jgi:proline iminopeptidase
VSQGTIAADDGCRLWTAETGRGTPLIMRHGGPGLWDMFGSLAATLPGHLRVIRWDQRGCGRSEHRGPFRVARSAADLDAVRSHLDLSKTALLGHSWGATLALRYALDHPDRVSALVYVSGTGLGWAWREPFQRAIAARLASHRERLDELRAGPRTEASDRELAILQWSVDFNDGHAMRHAEQMATPWFGINHDCFAQIWGELHRTWHEAELIDACRSFGVPVLIMDGSADLRPRSAVDSLAAALPNMTRVVLPGAGHVTWLEAPTAFNRPLLESLKQA